MHCTKQLIIISQTEIITWKVSIIELFTILGKRLKVDEIIMKL